MARNALPDREYLHARLIYNPKTGVFRWRKRVATATLSGRMLNTWNNAWAGKDAGTRHTHKYLIIIIDYHPYRAHRLAWLLVYGEPVPHIIDHIDGNPLNNRIANLRVASMSENLANQKVRSDSSTLVKGVRLHSWGSYSARITFRGKTHHLGSFVTLKDAAIARREAAERLHGEFARHG